MGIPDQEFVERILEKYEGKLIDIVLGAWEDWTKERSTFLWSRTRANIVWEHMIKRGHFLAEEAASVRVIKQRNSCLFLVDDVLCIRFKKGDAQGRSKNVQTNPQLPFPYHTHMLPFAGVPEEVPRVEIIYVLNNNQTKIIRVLVVARDESRDAWSYEMSLDSRHTIMPLPDTGTMQPKRKLAKIKIDATQTKKSVNS